MLLHMNPTRQRGKRTGSLARASGWSMTFFAAGVITNIHHRALVCPFAIPRLSSLERDATSRARSLRFQTKWCHVNNQGPSKIGPWTERP